jgi:hypothetical protein
MFKTLMCLTLAGLLQANPTTEAFKKEMAPLQTDIDAVLKGTGSQVMSAPRAALVEGYGVVVVSGVALEAPGNLLFPSATNSTTVLKNVHDRHSILKEKVPALIKQKLAGMESVGPEESLTIVIQLENYNTGVVKDLPKEIVFTAKKSNPQTVTYKEY